MGDKYLSPSPLLLSLFGLGSEVPVALLFVFGSSVPLPSSSLGLEILHGSLSFVLEFNGNGGLFLLSPLGFWFESILCFPFGFPLLGFCSCAGLEGGLVGAGSWGGKY